MYTNHQNLFIFKDFKHNKEYFWVSNERSRERVMCSI